MYSTQRQSNVTSMNVKKMFRILSIDRKTRRLVLIGHNGLLSCNQTIITSDYCFALTLTNDCIYIYLFGTEHETRVTLFITLEFVKKKTFLYTQTNATIFFFFFPFSIAKVIKRKSNKLKQNKIFSNKITFRTLACPTHTLQCTLITGN